MTDADQPFARFDFTAADGGERCFCVGRFAEIVEAREPSAVMPALRRLDEAVAAGRLVVGWLAYEAAGGVDPAMRTRAPDPRLPLLWFGIGGEEMAPPATDGEYRLGEWHAAVDADAYAAAFNRVQAHIRDGDTYQLNYTFPLRTSFIGDPASLYAAMRRAQAAGYCAWLHHPDWDIVSASPELFFAVRGDRIVTWPMKGTRPRGRTLAEDRALAAALRESPKDRAENVMIVDLLRNDLGRVAITGSVRPEPLFTVEKYPTVWQMTSTVEARLKPDTGLEALFGGLFPCGSVTGAPKVKTMAIIAGEEVAPRGVYCGAIGYARPGDAVFSVAIRTLTRVGGEAVYPVGSGVVADSVGDGEYAECLDKAGIFRRTATPAFALLETLRCRPGEPIFLLERHLDRLLASAEYFDYPAERETLRQALQAAVLGADCALRLRLLVTADGQVTVESVPLPATNPVRRVALASSPIDRRDVFLYHKTTHRAIYEAARAARPEADDVILYNDRGEVTEATIANLAVRRDRIWVTPPVDCGLLAGTMRAELIACGDLHEAVVTVEELRHAPEIHLLNSVRGRFPVVLDR